MATGEVARAEEPAMKDTMTVVSGTDTIRAILEGGPESIPDTSRVQLVSRHEEKIKLPHYGGYEHFERAGLFGGDAMEIIFRWTARTELAE
jgi:Family of unknown function (DUF5988)